uniref:RNA-directed DNA polymerase n=1 Tax=Strongyloides papillosus TaxID=174720 RepID=A0A0N5C203_STREA
MVIDQVLEPCKEYCFAYVDDILICSKYSLLNHFKDIRSVLQRLIDYNLKINFAKCTIAAEKLDFLGFEFTAEGRKPSNHALEAIDEIPAPRTLRALRRLLGKINFHRVFLHKISETEIPLLNLLKKNTKFTWNQECDLALQKIKTQLKQVCRLKLPDFSREFILHSDASQDSNAAVLMQQELDGTLRPIAFYSKRNPQRSNKCPAVYLELRGLVEAMQKFRIWLLGGFTRIFTDHKPLKNLILHNTDSRLYHYINIMSEYAYELEYLPGCKNLVADCLSRTHLKRIECPDNILITNPPIEDDIELNEQVDNSHESTINQSSDKPVDEIPKNLNELSRSDEPTSEEKLQLFQFFHDSLGHPCYERIKPLIQRRRSWRNLSKDLKSYLSKCSVCLQRNETHAIKLPNAMISATRPLESMNLDLLGPFPQSDEGYKFILGIIDVNTRYAIMEPIRSSSSNDILTALENVLFFRYGSPIELRVDNASYFRSSLFKTIKHLYGTTVNYGTAYLHESSAPIERLFRTLQNTISKLPNKSYHSWHNLVPKATFFYNSTIHSTLKCSPYKLWHGYEPVFKYDIENCKTNLNYIVDKDLSEHERQASWKLAQMMSDAMRDEANIPTPKTINKDDSTTANLKKLSLLTPGTKVLVKIPQLHKKDEIGKFQMQYESGYVVIKRENNSFYVRKHNRGRCRKVHVNFLKIDTSDGNSQDNDNLDL